MYTFSAWDMVCGARVFSEPQVADALDPAWGMVGGEKVFSEPQVADRLDSPRGMAGGEGVFSELRGPDPLGSSSNCSLKRGGRRFGYSIFRLKIVGSPKSWRVGL